MLLYGSYLGGVWWSPLAGDTTWLETRSDAQLGQRHSSERHHLLVTPIDWKLLNLPVAHIDPADVGHHSLVTPIDWKLGPQSLNDSDCPLVTTR